MVGGDEPPQGHLVCPPSPCQGISFRRSRRRRVAFRIHVRHHPHAHQHGLQRGQESLLEDQDHFHPWGRNNSIFDDAYRDSRTGLRSWQGRPRLSPAQIREGLASFYYDLTAATSPAQLFALQQMVPSSHLVMGFDNPFMPGWTFPPAIQDMQRWKGFSDTDVSSIGHQNAEALYPALAERLQRSKAA